MPTYFLNLTIDGERLVDDRGFEADNLTAARRYGIRHMAETLRMITRAEDHTIEGTLLDQDRQELIWMTLVFSAKLLPGVELGEPTGDDAGLAAVERPPIGKDLEP